MEATILKEEAPDARAPGGVSVELLMRRAIESDNPVKVYEELIPYLARLSPGEYAAAKTELREHFGRRLSVTELDKVVKAARKSQARAKITGLARSSTTEQGQEHRAGQAGPRPVVQVGGQLRDVVQSALSALARANRDEPSLFVDESGRLVRVNFSTKNIPSITPLTQSSLRYHMSLSADYVTIRELSDDTVAIAVDPPLDVVRVLLEMNPADYPFPPLSGITELPIMRPDGTIHQTPGYDSETEQVYIPGDLRIPEIAETPGPADVTAAREKLDFWLSDFPFVDAASKATALAGVITAVIRPVIAGQVPLTLLDAPKQGSGKTILAQGIGIVATGRIVPTNAPTTDEEEWRKKILTWLQTSPAVVIIDNIIHLLESSSLNTTLTSPYIEDRLLSTNELLRAENRAIWFASGNNIRVGDDTARRCVKCRLDARMENPHKRTGFKIPGGTEGFFNWTKEHRAELVGAALTLARNWYAQGRPAPDVTPLGSFEDWTSTIGGILQLAGVPGFLANLDDEDGNNSIDEVSAEWKVFVETLHAAYGNEPFTCIELASRMIDDTEQGRDLRETLPTTLTKNLDGYQKSQGKDREFPVHIGNTFRWRKGATYESRVCGKVRLDVVGKDRTGKAKWAVIAVTEGQADTPSRQGQELHQGQADTPSRQGQESKEETARKLLKWIEQNGGRVAPDSNGAVILTMPESYTDKQWKQLNARLQAVTLQVYQILNWPVDSGTID